MSCNTNITLSPVVYRDTWDGLSNCSFSSDGNAFTSNLSVVRMFFRDENGDVGLQLSSADSEIVIDDASNWEFTVNAVSPMTLSIGVWDWSIETKDAQNIVKTRIFGSLEILDDATQ
jgi:hypothetical protein